MRWRTVLGVTVGLVLPALFISIHSGVARWEHRVQAGTLQGTRVVPILPRDEQRALLTYGRTCQSEKDCDPPLACLNLFPSDELICVDSSCQTDLQCKQGFTCRTRQTRGEGALVRRCVLIGSQKEGTPCFVSALGPEEACEQGLICAGDHCGRPCQLDVPGTCPEGFVCRAGLDGPSCQPFCKEGECPTGQECVGAGTDEAKCMIVLGENCQKQPCAQGQECNITQSPGKEAWTAEMGCVTPCDVKRPCPEDSMCLLGGCRRRCGPDAQNVCGPRERCAKFPFDQLWLCMQAPD